MISLKTSVHRFAQFVKRRAGSLCFAALALLALFGALAPEHRPIEKKQATPSEISAGEHIVSNLSLHKSDLAKYIKKNMEPLLSYLDVDDTIQLVLDGLQKGQLNMYDCHGLLHELGHHAAIEHYDHLQVHVSPVNINACGGGFMHGVEDGLAANTNTDFREKLYSFCKLVRPLATEYSGCYHGAGHAFMRDTKDTEKALSLCHSLVTDAGQGITSTPCYRGVFSESLAELSESGSDNVALGSFCDSQDASLKDFCAMELVGGLTPASTADDAEKALESCTKFPSIQTTCLKSMSWEAANALLATRDSITPPLFIQSLDAESKNAYITGTIAAIQRMSHNKVHKDWKTFCASFREEGDRTLCRADAMNGEGSM